MPELPEVETVRRTLAPRVIGRRVSRVTVREARLRDRIAPDFAQRLRGRTISDVSRTGKYLQFHLDDGGVWLVHLGMTGCLTVSSASKQRHTHVRITLSDGTVLVYDDPRRFGLMKVVPVSPATEVAALGPDPLSEHFTVAHLRQLCRHRLRPIKNVLMDQRLVAGIGNIYANEILFRAAVRPSHRSRRLNNRQIVAIHTATRAVLREAIAYGGSSISDYRDGEGRLGYFQLRLDVYRKEGKKCPRCRTLIRAQVLAGRTSFYCPRCQR